MRRPSATATGCAALLFSSCFCLTISVAAAQDGATSVAPVDEATPPASTDPEAPPSAVPPTEAPPPEQDLEVGGTADEGHDWLDDLSIRVFVDAYVAGHWTLQGPFQGNHDAQLPQRVYDTTGGPTVNLMALDISYAPQPIGATLGIRFGTGMPRWIGTASGLPTGMQVLQQAFVSWRPISQFQIDFGEFTTNYGAEVAETWQNVTYTLGSLFQLVQPFYHAGFRAVWQPADWISITALAVNGYNNIVDNNDGKTGGLQVTLNFAPVLVTFGYLTGPEQAAVAALPGMPDPRVDGRLRHLLDAVVTLDLAPVRLVFNADYRTEDMGGTWSTLFNPNPLIPDHVSAPGSPQYQTLWGVSLGGNYRILPEFGIGARVEYVGQPDIDVRFGRDLVTGTFTIDILPVEHLVIRLDNRIDWLSGPIFADHTGMGAMQYVASSVLGVVVHSD